MSQGKGSDINIVENTVSIILLSYNSNNKLTKTYNEINRVFDLENINFEIIIMDDCSNDNSLAIAQRLALNDKRVRAHQLSKNYTSHYSIFAGLSIAKGNCAIPIPDDLQIPIESLVDMYNLWLKGNSIIIPYREERHDGFITKIFASLYYTFMNTFSDIKFPKGGADTFFIDREIIDIINNHISPRNTSSIVEVLKLGFNPKLFPVVRSKGINQYSRWTIRKKIRLALDTFISTSSFPIKLISLLGIFTSMISLIMIVYYIFAKFSGLIDVPGWTLLVIFISLFNGITLFSLGILAEYIWRIFDEVKGRPGYIIKNSK